MRELRTRVLFVCLGNICRSPLAEALLADLARRADVDDRFEIDSAGTGRWHVGEPADPRTREVGRRHGVRVDSRVRQVAQQDFEDFDLILAMDGSNLLDLQSQCPRAHRHKLGLMRDYDEPPDRGADVPDPYWGGDDGFDRLFEILSRCCGRLLESLTTPSDEQR